MNKTFTKLVAGVAFAGALGVSGAFAADLPVFKISIKDHKFDPAEITVPAGQKVMLLIKNEDPTPEEFESYELNREKIVAGNKSITVFVGPLQAGTYPFFGEFNPDTAQGTLIAE